MVWRKQSLGLIHILETRFCLWRNIYREVSLQLLVVTFLFGMERLFSMERWSALEIPREVLLFQLVRKNLCVHLKSRLLIFIENYSVLLLHLTFVLVN